MKNMVDRTTTGTAGAGGGLDYVSLSFRTVVTITVGPASPDDARWIAALEQREDTKRFIGTYSVAEHARNLLDRSMVYLRILDDGEIAGFFILVLDPDGTSVEFLRVVVAPERRGIGQPAVRAMERYCRVELGRQRIWLDVFEHNERGRHIYQKLGYQQFGRGSYQGQPLLLYQRTLTLDP